MIASVIATVVLLIGPVIFIHGVMGESRAEAGHINSLIAATGFVSWMVAVSAILLWLVWR